jgi:eukaryotic-like serine/threonine-protein kinase
VADDSSVPASSVPGPEQRLWDLWDRGDPPDVAAFLATAGDLDAAGLAAVLRVDQVRQWQSGSPVEAEEYLKRFPALAADSEAAVELIYSDFRLRAEAGEAVSVLDYQRRFPSHAARLSEQVELFQALAAQEQPDDLLGQTFTTASGFTRFRDSPVVDDLPAQESTGPRSVFAETRLPQRPTRLVLGQQIARGGMGAVYRAHDAVLGREVAVKVLLERHEDRSDILQRFADEARLAGQLQHPGVPPVYEVGTLADGRAFIAMKLIQGRTLAAMLKERQSASQDLPRLIHVFEQVCQTLAYAHQKGVIHRDLKPANVMVGAFGEVQVMDWGLAKRLSPDCQDPRQKSTSAGDDSSESQSSTEDSRLTEVGSIMGTLEYMAPEQARGENDRIDQRADVFGLGAILCEILSGVPPFGGHSSHGTLERAQRGDLNEAFARLDACGGEQELVDLAKRCLAAALDARPRDAGAVTAAMTAHLSGVQERLQAARLEQAAAQARAVEAQARASEARAKAAAERRARRLTFWLAVSVLILVLGGAGGGLFVQNQRAKHRAETKRLETEQYQAVEAALEKMTGLQERERWAEARAVLEEAKRRLGDTPGALRKRLDEAEKNLDLVARLDAIRQRQAVWVENHFDHASADRDYAEAFRKSGLGTETETPESVAARIRDSEVRAVLVAALDDWAVATNREERRAWLLAVARQADPDPDGWRDRFRDLAVWRSREKLEELANEAIKQLAEPAAWKRLSPQILVALANCLHGKGANDIPVLEKAQARFPADFWLNLRLGASSLADKLDDGIGYSRVALALRPDAAVAHYNLACGLHGKHQLDQAIVEYRQAIELDPKLARAYTNLGNALIDKGQFDQAITEIHKSIDLDPTHFIDHMNLGIALSRNGQLDEAVAAYRNAIDLEPKNAEAHNKLGLVWKDKAQLNEAIAEFRKAIALSPRNAVAYNNLLTAAQIAQPLLA